MDTYRGTTWENTGEGVIYKARAEASKKATGDTVALDSIPSNKDKWLLCKPHGYGTSLGSSLYLNTTAGQVVSA